ncbi:hypothetical protein [Phenylobacterium sp.]|uniref:hypothetical protein n=1 Tax=Phenylobacterium sp. TaxID=1871053 RepID=UPI002737C532|nr:hypothetical protein [Phenylobacterium sp.]MDP3868074.1 hypothetical protein [Phenylobacterium sp.]
MTSKAPPIPKEQQPPGGEKPDIAGPTQDRRDEKTGLQSSEPGDGDVNLKQQGRQGNTYQNVTTVHAKTQDR